MERNVYWNAHALVSPLGNTAAANFDAMLAGQLGVKAITDTSVWPAPLFASKINRGVMQEAGAPTEFTFFEQLLWLAGKNTLANAAFMPDAGRTLVIVSSTKGNIEAIENLASGARGFDAFGLAQSACKVAAALGFTQEPLVISNACISGVMTLMTGSRYIQSGSYDHVLVLGADVLSYFVLSGFNSFLALSDGPCRPFDADRKGINLGEAAGGVLLSVNPSAETAQVLVKGAAVTNDANHISGPSRSGAELADAITKALKQAGMQPGQIDHISAHGTATPYNDEMETKAFHHAGVQHAPVTSLKGYFGHTLGAAGIIESIIGVMSLRHQVLLPTPGYHMHGVSLPVTVTTAVQQASLQTLLKTASGFGGCNAALILEKQMN